MAIVCTTDSRIADASRTWQDVCDTDIADWNKANPFILSSWCYSDKSHGSDSTTFKMQWRRAGGTFADVGADTEICYCASGDTVLVDDQALTSGVSAGCQSFNSGIENETDNLTASLTVDATLYSEIQWGLKFGSGALYEQEYEFQLVPTAGTSAVCSVSITTGSAPSGWTHTIDGVAAANMASVDGVAKANISTIDGA